LANAIEGLVVFVALLSL